MPTSPYAISERSRRRNGFTVAKPEVRVADTTAPAARPNQRSQRSAEDKKLGSESDDHGDPIRLTGAENPPSQAVGPDRGDTSVTSNKTSRTNSRQAGTRRSVPPEIPQAPVFTPLPDIAETRISQTPNEGAGYRGAAVSGRAATPPVSALSELEKAALAQDQTADRDDQRSASNSPRPHDQTPRVPEITGKEMNNTIGAIESNRPSDDGSQPGEPAGLPMELTRGSAGKSDLQARQLSQRPVQRPV